jgi:aspartyl-tRNA(Asn)/glutamyl-tRNA(Gln) amidotransferase subunit A
MHETLHELTAVQLRNAFLQGDVTAVAIAKHFLKRVLSFDSSLKAFLSVLEVRALEKAERLDRKRAKGEPLGKMAAIPVAVKDNMHIEGEITTCASKFLHNYKAPFSATSLALMEQEDALFIGKTNLDEFAMGSATTNSAYFPTNNPWDLSKVPGGSSGGSSAAVAARMSLIATGSDTGGSIRQPAALCGIVGFKPTYGRVSRYGLVAFGSSLDQIGPLTSCVEDAALTMEVIGKHCPHDATSLQLPQETYALAPSLKGTVFGVPWKLLEDLDAAAMSNFKEAVEQIKQLGASVIDVDLTLCQHAISVYYILATAEASTNLARFDGIRYGIRDKDAKTLDAVYDLSRKHGFGQEVKRRILLGTFVLSAGFKDAYYKKAQQVRTLMINAFEKAFSSCDGILMPTAPGTAFRSDTIHSPLELYLQDIFTIPANIAGLPAISVPSGFDKEGLPFGLQIVGPALCDVSVMQYAYAYERATKHPTLAPNYRGAL